MSAVKKIIIAGGGLAGLITAIRLARNGFDCTLIEKKSYPFHRVCGEYISNETADFLKREGFYPEEFNPPQINQLQLSAVNGKSTTAPLEMGGFGISRYAYDNFLYELGKKAGVQFLLNTEVDSVQRADQTFKILTQQHEYETDLVVGAFGKRSRLDIQLARSFVKKRSPYVGIKYHARTTHPSHTIALHNFRGGYCGVSNIEDGKTNICYLTNRNNVKRFGNIKTLEEKVLFENPHLKRIFREADFIFEKPEVINEISFEIKGPVYHHILMAGDAAGMIAPLCGNGMAMAIHSAKILSDLIIANKSSQEQLEQEYASAWRKHFSNRLWLGRQIQHKLFGTVWGSTLGVSLALNSRFITNTLIKLTHGKTF